MGIPLPLLPAIFLLLILSHHQSTASVPQIDPQTSCTDHNLICELQDQKLRIARLESILEENTKDLNAKSIDLSQCEKLIEEMSREIDNLQSAVFSFKDDLSHAKERVKVLEEEVRLLWVASRKNNFELHNLESKAQDAERRLEVVTSQTEKMSDIVTEQWIQIQQLEQALQITEMRALTVIRQARSTRCSFLKFVKNLYNNHRERLPEKLGPYWSASSSYMSQALHHLKRTLSAAKHLHHRFQRLIKHELEKNEFTAALANNEVVFFVASALITFPILSAWMFLVSKFS
ncbi:hypothetical protein LguiA_014973 [Lonicera macranthoides]